MSIISRGENFTVKSSAHLPNWSGLWCINWWKYEAYISTFWRFFISSVLIILPSHLYLFTFVFLWAKSVYFKCSFQLVRWWVGSMIYIHCLLPSMTCNLSHRDDRLQPNLSLLIPCRVILKKLQNTLNMLSKCVLRSEERPNLRTILLNQQLKQRPPSMQVIQTVSSLFTVYNIKKKEGSCLALLENPTRWGNGHELVLLNCTGFSK